MATIFSSEMDTLRSLVKSVCSCKHTDSLTRMRMLFAASSALEEVDASSDAAHDAIYGCMRSLEDVRVKMHATLSLSVLDADCALTEDVCYFMVVAQCDDKLPCDRADVTSDMCMWRKLPFSCMSSEDLDDTLASLFQYAREVDWSDLAGVNALVSGLHARANVLLLDPDIKDYCGRRALWSCAVARLKVFVLQTAQWRLHRDIAMATGQRGSHGEFRSTDALVSYLLVAFESWNGPRLRESLAKAYNRRMLRPDETGRTAAFRGSNAYARSKGASDTAEEALHGLDLCMLLRCPRCVGTLLMLRELLIVKLLHNLFEANDLCDFMGRHVQLQSVRDCARLRQSDISAHVHRVWELPGGWVAVPHSTAYGHDSPSSLEAAFCDWYHGHFEGRDPLGIAAYEVRI